MDNCRMRSKREKSNATPMRLLAIIDPVMKPDKDPNKEPYDSCEGGLWLQLDKRLLRLDGSYLIKMCDAFPQHRIDRSGSKFIDQGVECTDVNLLRLLNLLKGATVYIAPTNKMINKKTGELLPGFENVIFLESDRGSLEQLVGLPTI